MTEIQIFQTSLALWFESFPLGFFLKLFRISDFGFVLWLPPSLLKCLANYLLYAPGPLMAIEFVVPHGYSVLSMINTRGSNSTS